MLVIVKTSGGGYFASYALATGSTSLARKVYFNDMFAMNNSSEDTLDLSDAIEIQFSPYYPRASASRSTACPCSEARRAPTPTGRLVEWAAQRSRGCP